MTCTIKVRVAWRGILTLGGYGNIISKSTLYEDVARSILLLFIHTSYNIYYNIYNNTRYNELSFDRYLFVRTDLFNTLTRWYSL